MQMWMRDPLIPSGLRCYFEGCNMAKGCKRTKSLTVWQLLFDVVCLWLVWTAQMRGTIVSLDPEPQVRLERPSLQQAQGLLGMVTAITTLRGSIVDYILYAFGCYHQKAPKQDWEKKLGVNSVLPIKETTVHTAWIENLWPNPFASGMMLLGCITSWLHDFVDTTPSCSPLCTGMGDSLARGLFTTAATDCGANHRRDAFEFHGNQEGWTMNRSVKWDPTDSWRASIVAGI